MKILMISLGCDKNLVDSEEMLGKLKTAGYDITNEEDEADIVVINTCAFIHDAKVESVETILTVCDWKKQGKIKGVIVTGCLSQYYQDDIREELPEIDCILGATSYDDIVNAVVAVSAGKQFTSFKNTDYLPDIEEHRIVTTGAGVGYLKLAEGCDKHCTYCVIPELRGRYRSIPMEDLLASAKRLVEGGVRELILVAQETTLYGKDLYGKKCLPELLKRLAAIEDLQWIRLLYCYPEEIDEALISVMAAEPKICHYIDMPIQHVSDAVLQRMGRRTTKAEITDKIAMLRAAMPDIVIRTTVITGFPGETEEQHQELLAFMDETEFNRLGAFPYSREEGTPAADMTPQIPDEVKEKRRDDIMALQQEISRDLNERLVGNTYDVRIEGYLYEDAVYVGRTYMDAPDIDGYIFVNTERELISGETVKVTVTGYNEYDLIGELCDEFTE